MRSIIADFEPIRASDGRGLYASGGELYRSAIFGRDSIEAAEDIVELERAIPREVIVTMAALQGLKTAADSEEEPGRIHHEARFRGDATTKRSQQIFDKLFDQWGGSGDAMIYYGSVDATPLFVRLVGKFVAANGTEILDQEIIGTDGERRRLREHVELAVEWILARIKASKTGFVAYHRSNPRGLENQAWKDHRDSYVHASGERANTDDEIAAVEVQAYAYDALLAAKNLGIKDVGEEYLRDFQTRMVDRFWLPERGYFAQAIDIDKSGQPRQLTVATSSTGLVLDSYILDNHPQQDEITKKTVKLMTSEDFLTPAGVRCRALSERNLVDYPDYHGSYAVWPKETSDIMRGMWKAGYRSEALEVARRIVATIDETGEFYEFFFVDEYGRIRTKNDGMVGGEFRWDERCHVQESGQAWTISAYAQAKHLLHTA